MIATVAVGTDGSATASKAVLAALELAVRYVARVVFMSAYQPVDESRLRREKRDAPPDIQWAVNPRDAARGEPADVLVRLADKHGADVLVIGNRGMHRRVLGSVPNSVTHAANCSVYLVKTV